MLRKIAPIVLALALITAPAAGQETAPRDRLKVVTTLFPLYDFARSIGADNVEVTLLLPPGVEAHSFEPTPADALKINAADIFVYTGAAMEPWAQDLLKGIMNKSLVVVDAAAGIPLEGSDPHVWLDFSYARTMADAIRDGFIRRDPAHKDFYTANARTLQTGLEALDNEFARGLAQCGQRTFIFGGHFAFAYLARRYGLQFIAAYPGASEEAEPAPRQLAQLVDTMKKNGIRSVFYESFISDRSASVIAAETGAALFLLNTAHNVTKEQMRAGVTFSALMRENLRSLQKGLVCQEQ